MTSLLINIAILGGVIAGIVFVCRAGSAYMDGKLDVQFPTVADGDWRDGVLRTIYFMGGASEERKKEAVQRRNILAEQRAAENARPRDKWGSK